MGHHCCSKQKVKRGLWSPEEDEKLMRYITTRGHGSWSSVPKLADLQRCGKSCRLRWINYLRPDLKRGSFSAQEERIIIDVHRILGNRWAQIAKHLPGRTDNEVKNFWNSCIKKKLIAQGLDPKTHNLLPSYAKNHACNLSQLAQQSPIPPFTNVSSQIKSLEIISNASLDINPPIITFPASQPSFKAHRSFLNEDMNSSSTNTTSFWHLNNQSSNAPIDFSATTVLENTPMSSSSSSLNVPFFGSEFTDENCMLASNVEVQELEQDKHAEEQQKQPMVCEMYFNESNVEKGHEIDISYNRTSLDLEFMESAFMPCIEWDD